MIPVVEKTHAHANVPLRLRRALQSRVEAPLFRKPCMKMRGFFDLGQPVPNFQSNPVFPKTI